MNGAPLGRISSGRADDAALLAAADLSGIAAELDVPYRLIGGNAVSLLTAVHGVSDLVPSRETTDADFGAECSVVADPRLLTALLGRGYHQVEGNRFTRTHAAPPAGSGGGTAWELVVDVLAPSYVGRL